MDPPLSSAPKLRLICSYGGRIVSRPQTKSFYYFGGENRLLTIPATDNTTTTLTLSSLTTHLSTFLRLTIPFTLKYQLPNHDLDSLISISTDDDLQIMLEEHKRISSSSTAASSRIRLFLFPVGNGDKAELTHPKRESWFVDALRSARMRFGSESGEQPESIPLETSSFGSTSSSLSSSSLPPIKPSPESIPSDECLGSAVSNVQTGTFQDQVGHIASMENRLCSNTFESDKKFADPSSGIEMHKPVHSYGFPVNLMHLPQQQTQVIHEDTHYVPPNMPGTQPVTSYYTVYYPVPQQQQQQQQLHYQANQPYPMYYAPVARTQPYNIPMQHGMVQAASIGLGQPQVLPNAPLIPTQVVLKEVAAVPQPVADLASEQYQKIPTGHQYSNVPHAETETTFAGAQSQHQHQPFDVAAGETTNQTNKLDDDPARVQIYKSQPPPPMLPSQYQTMTKATTLLLFEALAKLHTNNAEQQITASEP